MNMTKSCGWIWPKPTNLTCLNMTEYWQQRTFTWWTWPKTIDFRSYSPVKVPLCGNFDFDFWSSSTSERSSLTVFGCVHWFRSYSFGHVDNPQEREANILTGFSWKKERKRKRENAMIFSNIDKFSSSFIYWINR